jgi:hypothetical protein
MSKKAEAVELEQSPEKSRAWLYAAAALALCAAAIYGHVKVSADPDHIAGLPLVLDHLFNLLVAVVMFAIFFSTGRLLLSLFRFEWDSFAEEFAFCTTVGAGVLACLILVAALAGLLNRYVVATIFLAALIASASQLSRLAEVARSSIARDYSKPIEVAYLLSFALLLLIMIFRALTPPHAVDEAIYHLASVERFIEAKSLTPLYDIAQGNTHMLVHMLYAPCLMIGADSAAKLLSVGFSLVTALGLFAYARRFFDERIGYLAALAFFGGGMVVEVAVTARIDVTLAAVLFLATYAMTIYLEQRSRKWLWLSAFLSGVAVATKLTALIWVGALGLVYLVETLRRGSARERLRQVGLGACYFAIVVAVVSPWLVKNYVYFHQPFYPFTNGETVNDRRSDPIRYFGQAEEAKLEQYFQGAQTRNPRLSERINEILGQAKSLRPERHPFQFWGYFTNPTLYNVGEPFHNPNYLFILCPLFLLFGRDRKLIWLGSCCVIFFGLMVWSAWTARYLLPLYPPLTLIAAYTLIRATEWVETKLSLAKALPVVALVLTTGLVAYSEVSQIIRNRELNYINGSLTRADYMSLVFYYPCIRYVNEHAPANAKIFMMGSQMGYDLQRPYVADTTWESTPWRRLLLKGTTPEEVRNAMKAEGITHVLYSPDLYVFSTMTGTLGVASHEVNATHPDYYEQWRNWLTFEEFKAGYLEPIHQDRHGSTLFLLK